jgi:hypothetical protein
MSLPTRSSKTSGGDRQVPQTVAHFILHTVPQAQVQRREQKSLWGIRESFLDGPWWNWFFKAGIYFIAQWFSYFRLNLLKIELNTSLPENRMECISDVTQKSGLQINFPSDLDSSGPRTLLGEPHSRQMGWGVGMGGSISGRKNHLWNYK